MMLKTCFSSADDFLEMLSVAELHATLAREQAFTDRLRKGFKERGMQMPISHQERAYLNELAEGYWD